jgi:hypothetical protein
MPKTRTQKTVFSLLMGLLMVYAMQAFNQIVAAGLRPGSFAVPISEFLWLVPLAVAVQSLFVGRLAGKAASAIVKPAEGPTLKSDLAVQLATVILMCLTMSLVGTLVFKGEQPGTFWLKYLQTLATNIPMAIAFQLLIAEPVAKAISSRVQA